MHMAFATKRLRGICEDPLLAARHYSAVVVDTLLRQLADIRAAESAMDLPPTGQSLASNGRAKFPLVEGLSLLCRASPLHAHGSGGQAVDWADVHWLKVTAIAEEDRVA